MWLSAIDEGWREVGATPHSPVRGAIASTSTGRWIVSWSSPWKPRIFRSWWSDSCVSDVSINQFITTALAEKLAVLMTVEYLEERGKRGSRRKFRRALSKVRDRKPDAAHRL